MPDEIRLWRVGPDKSLREIVQSALDLELRLHEWLANDISILDPGLLVIGSEVETDFGGFIDLLCINAAGDIVVVELKRDKTPREITAQVLDYASWVDGLSNERIRSVAEDYLGENSFEDEFRQRFAAEVPETLNADHRMLVVGSQIDASSERIIKYLSDRHGLNINAATFQYFREPDGSEFIARAFLIEPTQVELQSRSKGSSKRRPNLTYEELDGLAQEAGVEELYRHAVSSFERWLQKGTTQSSITFASTADGSRKVVMSLRPGDSDTSHGLKYQLYKNRFAQVTGMSVQAIEELMPASREYWIYSENSGPEYEGFQGFLANHEEIDRLVGALNGE